MEVDEIHTQVCKFQRISCNGSSSGGGDGGGDNSSNPSKLADTHFKNHLFPVVHGGDNSLNPNESADTHNKNHLLPADGGAGGGDNSSNPSKSAHTRIKNHLFPVGGGGGGWPSSRIVRVSRSSGGKDRHSKVVTSKGLRDRRIRLSVTTAVEFYDLQDRLGYDQPSKAVEWLINAAATSISELPSLDPSFSGDHQHHNRHQLNRHENNNNNNNNNHSNVSVSKSSACSSTSETSKGSGNSRSENRIRARERARDMVAKRGTASQNSSFTDLLTGGGATVNTTTPMDYFQVPQFNISAGDNPPQHHRFCFQENFTPVVTAGSGGGGEGYHNLSFSIIPPPSSSSSLSSLSSSLSLSSDMNRGTLQSNLLSSLPHHLQRFQQSSMVDASTSANFPLFMAPTIAAGAPDHFPATGYDSHRLQLYSDHYKEASKN